MSAGESQELYGLLVPLLDERLLVPRACVAEVTSFQPLQEMPGAPPWYLGIQAWNGRGVPVVSFEGACGKRIPVIGGRTRIVIFTPDLAAAYFTETGKTANAAEVITAEEFAEWASSIADLRQRGRLFCSIGYYLFTAQV